MSIKVEYSVTAKCKPEHAWQKFEKLEEWPWWNHVIGKTQWLSGGRWQEGGRFSFEMQADDTTLLKTWEIFSGPLTMFIGAGSQKKIVDFFAAWLGALKEEAEKIARESLARS